MTMIRRGWFHLASGAAVGRVVGFVSNLLLSRWLGPTDLGLFNLVTTTVQTSDTLVRCGGDYAFNFELGGKPDALKTERGVQFTSALAQLCSVSTILVCVGISTWIWFGQGLLPVSFLVEQRIGITALLLLMIVCECLSASAWEILLVSRRTSELALRQGLFYPLRLLLGAFLALFAGVFGAMAGWSLVAVAQCVWLKNLLGHLWRPLRIWPLLRPSLHRLLRRGLPFYAANLLASMIFYPLLIRVATGSGLADIGYLRVGQILQQLFAFLPATLVPVLFLKLRSETSFLHQVQLIEKPLRIIWFVLLETFLAYCIFDQVIISWLFGSGFDAALLPTRLLLLTALFECLSQLAVQPVLAAGKTRIYGICQNGAAIIAAVLGWFWIPKAGIAAYLIARLLYVTIPLIAFGIPVARNLQQPLRTLPLLLVSFALAVVLLIQGMESYFPFSPSYLYFTAFLLMAISYRQDLSFVHANLRRRS